MELPTTDYTLRLTAPQYATLARAHSAILTGTTGATLPEGLREEVQQLVLVILHQVHPQETATREAFDAYFNALSAELDALRDRIAADLPPIDT